jgi:hypothetical protein
MWLVALAIALFVAVVPVMIAARVVRARRTGFGASLLALMVSYLIVGFALRAFHAGGLLSVLAAALGYMWILDTTYLRGLVVAVLQSFLTAVLALVAAVLLFGSLSHGVDRLLHDAPFQLDAPAQNV